MSCLDAFHPLLDKILKSLSQRRKAEFAAKIVKTGPKILLDFVRQRPHDLRHIDFMADHDARHIDERAVLGIGKFRIGTDPIDEGVFEVTADSQIVCTHAQSDAVAFVGPAQNASVGKGFWWLPVVNKKALDAAFCRDDDRLFWSAP